MRKTDAFRRAAALLAALSITVSLAAPAFAGTYYIDYGDITITKDEHGKQTVQQGETSSEDEGEIIITTYKKATTTLESDLEGPAAEDSGFGPVVEENYQPAPPAQPEDAEEPKDDEAQKDADRQENTDRKESDEEQKDADQPENTDWQENAGQQPQPQPQQAAPAAAPAAPAPVNPKENGFFGNTITVINNFANTALKLTLRDVKIDVSETGNPLDDDDKGNAALSVQGEGDVEIELDGKNELKSGFNKAGLEKNTSEGTLTLKDDNKDGSLKATGGESGAGIGGSYNGYSANNGTNNIIITGGTVEATGGGCAAGIGGSCWGSGKNITITGGTVTAQGGANSAGYGGGYGGGYGSGEDITVNGGTVTATGGYGGAGIGSGNGWKASGKNITINSGTVKATGGENGAGIGGGHEGSGEHITINGGTVNATGGEKGAGIGGGFVGSGGKNITINSGTVNAAGGRAGAGIGGGSGGSGEAITINGGAVDAKGGNQGAGIGGGVSSSGEHITITGGTVTAAGGYFAAGIGGGSGGSGSNVTVSGAAQVTAVAGKSKTNLYYPYDKIDSGATIGNGRRVTSDALVNGEEIKADISGLMTTGYIHHIIYNEDGSVKQEWREFGHLQPAPDTPNAPAEETNEVDLGTPGLHVETLEGSPLPFNARRQGSTLRVTTDNLSARLYGTRQALEAMREQGVEQIQFVTTLKTTTLSVEDLLAEGGSWFALEHDGLVSRRLSAAQAESLKCRMR